MLNKKSFLILIFSILTIGLFIPKELEATIYGSIRGKVIREDTGAGVKGVKVALYHWKGGSAYNNTVTDKNGNFYFDMIPEGEFYLLFSPPPPLIKETFPFENKVILGKGENITNYIKSLEVGGSLTGAIYGGDGTTPLDGVGIKAIAQGRLRRTVESGLDGKYIIGQLEPNDNYVVEIYPEGYAIQRIKGIKVEAYKETSGIDFIIDLEDITGIEGKILSSKDGKPLINIGVAIFNINKELRAEAVTDENGKYSISNLEPGIYEIAVYPPGLKLFDDDIIKGNIFVRKGEKTNADFLLDSTGETFRVFSNDLGFFYQFVIRK